MRFYRFCGPWISRYGGALHRVVEWLAGINLVAPAVHYNDIQYLREDRAAAKWVIAAMLPWLFERYVLST